LEKILIIRFSSIGDIVLTSPVIRTVKQQRNAEVHYLTKKSFEPLLRANPYIDRIHTIEKNVSEVMEALKAVDFDLVIDLHKNLRSSQARILLKKPSVTFSKVNFQKWLYVTAKIDRLPRKHIVDRYFDALKPLGIENDGKGLDYFIPEKDEVSYDDLPDFLQEAFVGIVVGGKHNTKIYPAEKVANLCKEIKVPVILLGGPEDKERAEQIRQGLSDIVFNGCGEFNINQSASIIRKAGIIISNDTGLMHIAAALKKKIVALWGNTVPEFGMYPYYPDDMTGHSVNLEVEGLSCRPCSKLGYKKCPKGHFNCMYEIDEQEVLSAVKTLQKDYS
jgi:ADP-heptose:LPS heptosyltransferase